MSSNFCRKVSLREEGPASQEAQEKNGESTGFSIEKRGNGSQLRGIKKNPDGKLRRIGERESINYRGWERHLTKFAAGLLKGWAGGGSVGKSGGTKKTKKNIQL